MHGSFVTRRAAVIILGLLFFAGIAHAAGGPSGANTRLKELLGGLDLGDVPTGILYDRVVRVSRIDAYDGGELAPPIGLREWRQIYFELGGAVLDAPAWPRLRDLDRTAERAAYKRAIPIAFMTFDYNRIRPDAFEDGTLGIRGDRVVRLSEGDPYAASKVHAVTAWREYTHRGERVVFSFEHRLYLSNDARRPVSVEVDFDDGLGFRTVRFDSEETVRYAESGRKTVRTRTSFADGRILHGGFFFHVEHLQTPNPDDTLSVTASIPYEGQYGTGEAYVYLAAANTSVTNPVVIVEGFDLDNTMNWDELYQLLNQEDLLETLRGRGFDAIVLNFTDATDYVQRNSLVVVELLQQVQAFIDPYHSIALVGGSMGALCGRYALSYMENVALDHGVRTFVSFDGPHGGANIPLGIQYWLDFFSDLSEDAEFLLSRLDTPAARQMLVYHHTTPPGTTGESDSLRAVMAADFASVGGYPSGPRRVAFANGSGYQAGQGFLPGDQIIDYEYTSLFISIVGNVWAVPDVASGTIFDGLIRIIVPTDDLTVTVSGTSPFDNAPGGRRNSMAQMDSTEAPYGDIVALHTHHCFVPTVSALDLATSDLFYDIGGDPDIYSLTPFDAVYFPMGNEDHMTITAETAGWLVAELEAGVTGVTAAGAAPDFELAAPFPNPAGSGAEVRLSTERRGPVEIAVYDVRGRRVATLLESEDHPAGSSVISVNTRDFPSGVYFVRLYAPGVSLSRKLVVLR